MFGKICGYGDIAQLWSVGVGEVGVAWGYRIIGDVIGYGVAVGRTDAGEGGGVMEGDDW